MAEQVKQRDALWEKLEAIHSDVKAASVTFAEHKGRMMVVAGIVATFVGGLVTFAISVFRR